jgi:hypothetical protein
MPAVRYADALLATAAVLSESPAMASTRNVPAVASGARSISTTAKEARHGHAREHPPRVVAVGKTLAAVVLLGLPVLPAVAERSDDQPAKSREVRLKQVIRTRPACRF